MTLMNVLYIIIITSNAMYFSKKSEVFDLTFHSLKVHCDRSPMFWLHYYYHIWKNWRPIFPCSYFWTFAQYAILNSPLLLHWRCDLQVIAPKDWQIFGYWSFMGRGLVAEVSSPMLWKYIAKKIKIKWDFNIIAIWSV